MRGWWGLRALRGFGGTVDQNGRLGGPVEAGRHCGNLGNPQLSGGQRERSSAVVHCLMVENHCPRIYWFISSCDQLFIRNSIAVIAAIYVKKCTPLLPPPCRVPSVCYRSSVVPWISRICQHSMQYYSPPGFVCPPAVGLPSHLPHLLLAIRPVSWHHISIIACFSV